MVTIGTGAIPLTVVRRLPKYAFAVESESTAISPARLHPDDLAAILASCRTQSPWMTFKEAADYLRCPPSRVRKLTMTGDLPHEHDGRRVLYHRDEVDRFIRDGGAISP
jgi:excisionase family DNA binding protein